MAKPGADPLVLKPSGASVDVNAELMQWIQKNHLLVVLQSLLRQTDARYACGHALECRIGGELGVPIDIVEHHPLPVLGLVPRLVLSREHAHPNSRVAFEI